MTNEMEAFHMEEFGARVPIAFVVSPEGWAVWVAGPQGHDKAITRWDPEMLPVGGSITHDPDSRKA